MRKLCNKAKNVAVLLASGIFFTGLILQTAPVHGQSQLKFIYDTVTSNSGSMFELQASLINSTQKKRSYRIGLNAVPFQLVHAPPDSILLFSGHKQIISLLFYVPRKTDATKNYSIQLSATDEAGDVLTGYCRILVESERSIYLTAAHPDIYLVPGEDSVRMQFELHNSGNIAGQVVVAVNDQLTNQALLRTKVYLPSFTDTSVILKIRRPLPLEQESADHFLVTGQYKDGTVFSTIQLNVFNTNSRKNYAFDPRNEVSQDNELGFYTHFLGTGMQYEELLGKGLLNAGKNRISYQLDGLYYGSGNQIPFVLMNSDVTFLTNRWNVQAGNIYRNLEIFLNGRGAALELTPNSSTKWGLGFVNNNYNLVGKLGDQYYNRGNAIYGKYAMQHKNISVGTLFIQQWDPAYEGNSTLGGGSFGFSIHHHHQIQLGAYTSYHSKGINQKDSTGNWGGALRASYSGSVDKWQLESSNYFSTKGYAGYQKGAANLEQRINFTQNNVMNFWARYSKISSHSSYIYPGPIALNPSYLNETAELGMNRYFRKNLLMTIQPYYSHERSYNSFINSFNEYAIRALHLDVTLNYNGSQNQNLYLNADAGWSGANFDFYRHYFAWKLVSRYQDGPFSLNVSYQHGPYYSSELAIFQYTREKYGLITLSPAFNGHLFQNKIALNAYNSVAYEESYHSWTDNFNVNITWYMRHNMNLVFDFNKIQYFLATPGISEFDLGIVKKFNNHRQGKRYNLMIHLFEDKNGNYHWDLGEKPAVNQLVRVGTDIFRTDEGGNIFYKRIPGGDYHVSVLQSNGMIAMDTVLGIYGKTSAYIPLHKIGILSGKVQIKIQQFSYNTDESVAGIGIVAVDKTGKKFNAITDEHGNFTLYLPLNNYTVLLETTTLPDKYICDEPIKKITLTKSPQQPLTFTILVQKRKIEIRKFKSSTVH